MSCAKKDFDVPRVPQELVSMTPEQKSSEPHSFFMKNQMCRDVLIMFLILKLLKYCGPNELSIGTETLQS